MKAIIWAVLTLVTAVLAFAPAIIVGGWLEREAGESAVIRLASTAFTWTLLASGSTVILARVLVPGRKSPVGLLVVAAFVGAVAAASTSAGIVIWTEETFGRFDPEFVVGSLLLAPMVTLLTAAFAGWLMVGSAPARAFAAAVGAIAISLIVLLSVLNLRGVLDGLGEAAWALGLALAAAVGSATLLGTAWKVRASRAAALLDRQAERSV